MIAEDIKNLISHLAWKKSDTLEPETVEELVKPPPLTIYTIDVLKLDEDSPLTTWVFESLSLREVNWKKVHLQIHDILAFTQTLGYLHCFHPKDIHLLLIATTNHFLHNTSSPFESKDLELTTVLNEWRKRPKITLLTAPYWVLKEWDDIWSFIRCGQHLVLHIIAEQLEDPPIPSRPKGQDKRDPPEIPTR